MRIEQNILAMKTESARKPNQTGKPVSGRPLVSFDENDHLNQALADAPDARAEKVARGKALVADPNYPSKEQVKKIASLLAENWNSADALTDTSAAGIREAAIMTAVG